MGAWDDPNTKPHVRAVAAEIRDSFGIKDIGGYRSGPDAQDHGLGLALDVMTVLKGQMIADWAVANHKRLSITYVIWARRIWDSRNSRGWEAYTRANPHTDHVHISFFPTAGESGNADVPTDLSSNSGCLGWLGQALMGLSTTDTSTKG